MSARKTDRRQAYLALHDFSVGLGLEIGPLHRTIVAREDGDVRYVEVADQAGPRAHYAPDSGVDSALIPEIDYVLLCEDGSARSLAKRRRAARRSTGWWPRTSSSTSQT